MTFIPPPIDESLLGEMPAAFGGCACQCHRVPGVFHIMACCSPAYARDEPKPRLQLHFCRTADGDRWWCDMLEPRRVRSVMMHPTPAAAIRYMAVFMASQA